MCECVAVPDLRWLLLSFLVSFVPSPVNWLCLFACLSVLFCLFVPKKCISSRFVDFNCIRICMYVGRCLFSYTFLQRSHVFLSVCSLPASIYQSNILAFFLHSSNSNLAPQIQCFSLITHSYISTKDSPGD